MNNSKPPSTREKKRLIGIAIFIFVIFSLLLVQFYRLQILEGKHWTQQAKKQHYFVIQEPFRRGSFYANSTLKADQPFQLQPFVIDVPKFHLYIDPESIPAALKKETATKLLSFLSVTEEQKTYIEKQIEKRSRSRKLLMWLDKETQTKIEQWWYSFARQYRLARNAIFFIKDYQRSYPFGKILGQVLHTIQHQKETHTDQALPTGGLELFFNDYLKGKPGKKRLMRSPRHALEISEMITSPEHGANIYLTINPYLQAIAEEEIEKGVKKNQAKGGWAVIMDPYTGEILALAQYPFFYPPHYQTYFNQADLVEHTKVKAVTDANEPGSVFKPFTIAIALMANEELKKQNKKPLFSVDEKIDTLSGRFPGRSKPITDTSSHHYLNMNMAMQKSSNIYMARLVQRIIQQLGSEWYRQKLQLFGFGQKTNIELPAESPGVLPTPGKLHRNGTLEWSIATPFSLAFGHNLQVNTIQLLKGYAIFANGGYLVEPTLIRKIVKSTQDKEITLIDHTTKEHRSKFPRVISEDIIKHVMQALRFVTKPGGTSIRADVPGYTECGKSSTPKKIVNGVYSEYLYCPVFLGLVPAKTPRLAIAVTIDEPLYGYILGRGKIHNGGNCTAAIFREIATASMHYLGVVPDDPYGYPYGDPRRDIKKTEWMQETSDLQELYKKWNHPPQPKSNS